MEAYLESHPDSYVVALVNNAGVALPGPLEVQPIKTFQRQIEVNLTGHVRVTQRFLRYLRNSRKAGQPARIINTVSIAGR